MRYARPAVYVERLDAAGTQPIVLRTDVSAFVGIARRGPLHTAIPVESFRQFAAFFGEFTGAGYLAYAVRGFFENGGRRCWVVRVARRDAFEGASEAAATVRDLAGRPALRVAASSPGSWGDALTLEWAVESGSMAISRPSSTTALYATVTSTAGFERSVLVRVEQAGSAPAFRVVSAVEGGRLYWVHPESGGGLPTDRPLTGLDLGRPLRISPIAYSLTVREGGRFRARYGNLHLVPGHERHVARLLGAPELRAGWMGPDAGRDADLPRVLEPVVVGVLSSDDGTVPLPLQLDPGAEIALSGGADGLATLSVDDFIGEPVIPEDSDFVKSRKTRGLQALAEIGEIALVAMPDLLIRPEPDPVYEPAEAPPTDLCVQCPAPETPLTLHQPAPSGDLPPVFSDADIARAQAALLAHCEAPDDPALARFAVLSLPFGLATGDIGSRELLTAWRRQFDSRNGALYAPWVDVVEPRRGAPTRRVPACGHVVGAIARVDLSAGVHHAPANLTLHGATDLSRHFDDTDHGELSLSGIDVLRVEFGRPPTMAGAYTLSTDPDWRYVHVVRLVLTLKKAIGLALRWVVFEPNSHATRAAVAASLTGLLQAFFERGAFKGGTPEESYFVRCDEVTTPPEARETGRLVALVGIAPAVPCEFIVLRVGHEDNALSVALYGEAEAAHA